jgi:hypothetical protein
MKTALALILLLPFAASAQPATAPADLPATLARSMRFSDADKTDRVAALTADYLRQLQQALDQRQAALARLGEGSTPEIDKQTVDAYRACRTQSLALRDAYVAQLNTLMTPFQVERIKDGLTGDLFHHLVQLYDEMVPGLKHAERAHIASLLTEMRENAMLETDPERQRKWGEKYRGIINNYISKQGYDFKSLAKAYDEKRKASGQ